MFKRNKTSRLNSILPYQYIAYNHFMLIIGVAGGTGSGKNYRGSSDYE
jgi:hypothetical protein